MHNIRNITANALIIVLKKEQVNRYLCLTSSIVFREIWIFINASNPLLRFNSSTNIKKKEKNRIILPLLFLSFVPFIPQYWNFLHRPISLWSRKKEGALLEDYQPSQNSRVHHSRWLFYAETWSSFGNS